MYEWVPLREISHCEVTNLANVPCNIVSAVRIEIVSAPSLFSEGHRYLSLSVLGQRYIGRALSAESSGKDVHVHD